MAVYIALISVLLPLLAAAVSYLCPSDRVRKLLGTIFAFMNILAAAGLFVLIIFISKFSNLHLDINVPYIDFIVRFINVGLLLLIISKVLSAKKKRIFTAILCGIQIILLFVMETFVATKLEGTLIYLDAATAIALMSVLLLGATAVMVSLNGAKGLRGNMHVSYIFALIVIINCAILSNNISWFHFFWQLSFFATYFIIQKNISTEDHAKSGFLLNLNIISGISMVLGMMMIYTSNGTTILTQIADKSITQGSPWYFSYGFGFIMLAVILRFGMFPFARFYNALMRVTTKLPIFLLLFVTAFPGLFLMLRIAPVLHSTMLGKVISAYAAFVFAFAAFLLIFEKDRQMTLFYTGISGAAAVISFITLGNTALYGLGLTLLLLNVLHIAALKASFVTSETNDSAVRKLASLVRYVILPVASFGIIAIKFMAIEIAAGEYMTSIVLVAGYVFEIIYALRQFSDATLKKKISVRSHELKQGFGKMRGTLYATTIMYVLSNVLLLFFLKRAILPYINNVLFKTPAGILVSEIGIWPLNAEFAVTGGGKIILGYAAVILVGVALYFFIYRRRAHTKKQEPFLCGVNFISENILDEEQKFTGPADTVVKTSYAALPELRLPNYIDFIALIYILAMFGVLIK